MTCPVCEGTNSEKCEECKGAGRLEIIDCPRKQLAPEVWEMLRAAHWAREGTWPRSGGWLNQTLACVTAVEFILNYEAKLDAEAIKSHGKKR